MWTTGRSPVARHLAAKPASILIGARWQQRLQGVVMSGKCADDPEQEKNKFLTPGGFRPKERVRRVKPGEVVRREADGTYAVVPEETRADTKDADKRV